MLRSALIVILILALTEVSFAQIHAVTEDGENVLLYDNGTWQYESKIDESTSSIMTESIIAPAVTVDSTREISTDLEELFYLPSPRLERYFGESKSKIRCKLGTTNNHGSVTIQFSWEIPVVDGDRYFGLFWEGTNVVFTMRDGQKIEVTIEGKSDVKRLEKHNFSVIANSTYPLTAEYLTALTAQPIRKMEVDWRKKSEEYNFENSRILMDLLPEVF